MGARSLPTVRLAAPDAGTNDPEEAAEAVLDAGRLAFYGHIEAQQELIEVLRKYSWERAIRYLAREHPLV